MKSVLNATFVTGLLLGLPLLGARLAGHDVRQYSEFPPLTLYASPAPFAWLVFIILAVLILLVVVPFIIKVVVSQPKSEQHTRDSRAFPWWGWGGLLVCGISWVLAWTRFDWFAPLQSFTFTPLWLSLIVIVNAVTYKRTGECSLTKRPWFVAALFPVSAVFWWFFEFLNRFVQNWVYQNVEGLSPFQYFLYATLPFSTVLPAVYGVYEMLRTFPRVSAGLEKWIVLRIQSPRLAAWAGLIVAGVGLVGISIWPDYLFPLLWVAPLVVIVCIQVLQGRETIFASLSHGNWKAVYTWALAALICGFFWEMWNLKSYSRWIYTVPFVNRFLLFEMPALGYSGYLPFGLQCAVVTLAVDRWFSRRRFSWRTESNTFGRIMLSMLMAAILWLSCLHLFFKPRVELFRTPTGMPPRAAALASRHIELWSEPALRQGEIERMRYSNAEWDFMARTYFVLALSNMALRAPDFVGDYLPIMDAIIDETIRLEEEYGMYHFLMGYARRGAFRNSAGRSDADIDSGPIIPLLDISAGASGMAVLGAAVFDDIPYLTALLTSLNYGGFPIWENGRLRYAASNQVGDAVLLYAMVAGPLWDEINNRAPSSVDVIVAEKEITQ